MKCAGIMLCEMKQTEKDKYCIFCFNEESKENKISRTREQNGDYQSVGEVRNADMFVTVSKVTALMGRSSGDLMHSTVTVINNDILQT